MKIRFGKKKPSGAHREEAMKAKEIVNNAFAVDKQNAKYVAPASLRTTSKGWQVTTVTKEPGHRSRNHVVTIQMPKGYSGKFNKCDQVKILCNCQRFLFIWNYALVQHGAAVKDLTNGQPPVEKNPREIPGGCKHAITALSALIKINPDWPDSTYDVGGRSRSVTLTTLRNIRR